MNICTNHLLCEFSEAPISRVLRSRSAQGTSILVLSLLDYIERCRIRWCRFPYTNIQIECVWYRLHPLRHISAVWRQTRNSAGVESVLCNGWHEGTLHTRNEPNDTATVTEMDSDNEERHIFVKRTHTHTHTIVRRPNNKNTHCTNTAMAKVTFFFAQNDIVVISVRIVVISVPQSHHILQRAD